MSSQRKRPAADVEFDVDNTDGAVDIVFLLIIFFLVASSFSSEKREKVELTERREEVVESPTPGPDGQQAGPAKPQGIAQKAFRIVLQADGTVQVGGIPLDLEEPNSLELYYKVSERLQVEMDKQMQEGTIELNPKTGVPDLPIQIWTDKTAQSGMAMHSLMACLDKGLQPDVLFLQELEKKFPGIQLKSPEELQEAVAAGVNPYEESIEARPLNAAPGGAEPAPAGP